MSCFNHPWKSAGIGFVLFLSIVCSTLSTSCAKTLLKVGVYNNTPTIFVGENHEVQGLFIDVLEEIARQEDWQLEYVVGHFSVLLDDLNSGKIDLLPALAYSKLRDTFIDYSYETVMANWAELYIPKSSQLKSLLELDGKKIAVKQGDIHFKALKGMTENFNLKCRFLEADEYETVFEMLDHEYADVGVVNRLFGTRKMHDYKIQATPVIFNPIRLPVPPLFSAESALFSDTLEIMREARGIEQRLNLDQDLLNIRGAAAPLTKILMNLLKKSVEANVQRRGFINSHRKQGS